MPVPVAILSGRTGSRCFFLDDPPDPGPPGMLYLAMETFGSTWWSQGPARQPASTSRSPWPVPHPAGLCPGRCATVRVHAHPRRLRQRALDTSCDASRLLGAHAEGTAAAEIARRPVYARIATVCCSGPRFAQVRADGRITGSAQAALELYECGRAGLPAGPCVLGPLHPGFCGGPFGLSTLAISSAKSGDRAEVAEPSWFARASDAHVRGAGCHAAGLGAPRPAGPGAVRTCHLTQASCFWRVSKSTASAYLYAR